LQNREKCARKKHIVGTPQNGKIGFLRGRRNLEKKKVIDLHTHSIFSDGELIPSELVRRAVDRGYRALAITDHADLSNIDLIVPRMVKVCRQLREDGTIWVIPGIELTHVPPRHIAELAGEGRRLGAEIVVVHGETVVEPVMEGTNLAAVTADIDILAHPGLVTDEVARLAAEKGICFEISTRKGHSLTNGHVVACARKHGVTLVLNTDSHAPGDLVTKAFAQRVAAGAGLTEKEIRGLFRNSKRLVRRCKM